MRILIVAHFTQMPNEKGNNRFSYIINELEKNKNNYVELITSSFSHNEKKQRVIDKEELDKINYKITNIYEPGYKKNVSIKRFYSHYIMSKNLGKYLYKLEYKPDVIYCAIPSLDIAKVTAKFAKKNNIKFIIDVQDLWPEAFKMIFNIPILSSLIFLPMKLKANYIYKSADSIVAVSDTYLARALKVNKTYKNAISVFLGTELSYFDKCRSESKLEKEEDCIQAVYIGTLGHSYDIITVIDAISILNNIYKNNIKLVVMGNGPLREKFENYAKIKKINYEFTGNLDYDKMIEKLCNCDIALNPINKGAAQSIINKVGDYAAAGLPVISTQECEEYRKLIEKYNIGFNCTNGDSRDIANKIEILFKNKNLRETMGYNNRKLAEEKFDRKKTYINIINIILGEK